ncbi:CYTH and CHAD domain-containing protein [Cellulomonas fimi]|uniref:CHAD domain containing protein n=1 Tax=Cellulomonas fimi (strain ATCC 484 / DSM 20113 / JCM 1341 / CCUG 24087 / LMG 16345 / NBRC 15513 / NCIMB 8980 / NCTC 7547 / NRS-133) TaxID=590998 RepID=F4H3G7_CELFA|nr:CYTH and CHAD domain-containing protein [Cellulomonas fimi]AEE46512.1 CHAD domain containing protein [Cellulomonas fimi ATCC 484]NNH08863.1 CYTH and CHAD domain-containing protein [Cellulomonas fimi]VEH33291.1 Uncharacterized conserved protein [Cellulomonas fimi]
MAHREVETAFEVGPDVPLPDLSGVAGVARTQGPASARLVATYWDTPGRDLTRAGVSLRRRTGGDDAGWHLKVPAPARGPARLRTEHRRPGDASSPPADLVALVRGRVREQPLAPVVELVTDRSTTRLVADDGTVLAEVADDVVTVHPVGGDDTAVRTWREWEVEAVAGDEVLVEAVGAVLASAGGTVRAASKVRRALGDAVPDPPSTEPRDGSAGEAVRAALARHVARLLAADVGLRLGDDEAVHDARVAVRRLRAALAVYRPVVDRAVTDPVRDRLRHVGHVLGAARDAHVERAVLAERLDAEPVELVLGPVAARVAGDRSAAHAEALQEVAALLDDPEHLALLALLESWSVDLPRGPRAGEPAQVVVPRRARRAWRRLERLAASVPRGEGRDDAWHEVRKAARRARYASEVAQPVVGSPARRSARRARDLQDVLGDRNDTVVRRATLRRLGVEAHLDGENAFTYGRLHALEQCAAERADARAATVLQRAVARGHRRWAS